METKNWPDHFRFIDSIGPSGVTIKCCRFIVIGETERCYYVMEESLARMRAVHPEDWTKRNRKRVLKSSWRRYCYPDLREAMASYKARKRHQVGHARIALDRAEAGLTKATQLLESGVEIGTGKVLCDGGDYIKSLCWDEY